MFGAKRTIMFKYIVLGWFTTDFGETKQNEALRKLTKANERLGLCTGTCTE